MTAAAIIFGLGLAVAAALGWAVVAASRRLGPRLAPATPRLTRATGRFARRDGGLRFGDVSAAGTVALAGSVAAVGLAVPIGLVAGALERSVDRPVFDWMDRHLTRTSTYTSEAQRLTQMGNNRPSQVLCVAAGVLLALWWARRPALRRVCWFPLVALLAVNLAERFGQLILARVVDRGHPPATFEPTLGTYPSGGSARVVCVWGLVAVLMVAPLAGAGRRRAALLLGALVSGAAFTEGYTRTYLLKHWVTDVVGGWLFGALLLVPFALAVALVTSSRQDPTDAH